MRLDQGGDDLSHERVDLRALDPDMDAGAEERFVRAVLEGLGAVAPPRVPSDPLYGLWSLSRPLLIAASLLSFAVLGIATRARLSHGESPATVADATGVPSVFLANGDARP